VLGGELACKRTLEIAETFELGSDTPRERTVSFTKDSSLVGAIGLIVAYESGVGRTRTFELSRELASDLSSLVSPEALIERIGSAEVGFELQDRRQKNVDVAFAVDVSGNGGGIEIELEWADQGRMLARSTTIREGIQSVLHGASEAIDVATGTVLQVQ